MRVLILILLFKLCTREMPIFSTARDRCSQKTARKKDRKESDISRHFVGMCEITGGDEMVQQCLPNRVRVTSWVPFH